MTIVAIVVVKNKKQQKTPVKIESINRVEIDPKQVLVEKPIESVIETSRVIIPTDQPKKKRKYHKKKHPKKMDANKK
jgi:hypothetical protein